MRIDYSEPKKSYVSPQGSSRPRRESGGSLVIIVLVTGVITFAAGFATGWFLSQKAAKKSFQAASEQTSLESAPKKENASATTPAQPPTSPPAQPGAAPANQPQTSATPPSVPPSGAAVEPPLSFYKALPSGQKNTVLGSGINARDEHTKAPLQAPIPANLNKPAAPEPTKPAAERPAASDKPAAKPGDSSYTVQVSSYPLKSEAEAQRSKLAAKGYHVYIVESNQGDKGVWYRVRVGKKLEHDAAKELAGKLGKTAMVIPDRE